MTETEQKLREQIAQKICCLYPQECPTCKKGKGCPDEWKDITEQVDQIFDLFQKAGWTSPEATRKLKEHIAKRTGQLTQAEIELAKKSGEE